MIQWWPSPLIGRVRSKWGFPIHIRCALTTPIWLNKVMIYHSHRFLSLCIVIDSALGGHFQSTKNLLQYMWKIRMLWAEVHTSFLQRLSHKKWHCTTNRAISQHHIPDWGTASMAIALSVHVAKNDEGSTLICSTVRNIMHRSMTLKIQYDAKNSNLSGCSFLLIWRALTRHIWFTSTILSYPILWSWRLWTNHNEHFKR